jgi:hypothetical protein
MHREYLQAQPAILKKRACAGVKRGISFASHPSQPDMSIILWAMAPVISVLLVVLFVRKRRPRRERRDNLSLSPLGTVSQQWLTEHRAEN